MSEHFAVCSDICQGIMYHVDQDSIAVVKEQYGFMDVWTKFHVSAHTFNIDISSGHFETISAPVILVIHHFYTWLCTYTFQIAM